MKNYLLELLEGRLELGDAIVSNINSNSMLIVRKKLSNFKYETVSETQNNITGVYSGGTVCKNIYGIAGTTDTSSNFVVVKKVTEYE